MANNKGFTTIHIAVAVIVTALVTTGLLVSRMNQVQDTRSSARGVPEDVSIPDVAKNRVEQALAKMEQVVEQIEQHNGRVSVKRGRPSEDIAALARQLEKDQQNIEYLLAVVRLQGTNTSGYEADFEDILEEAEDALNRASTNANERSQEHITEALENVEEALLTAQEARETEESGETEE